MTSKSVEGEWGRFVFKMVTPNDHERVLKHLRDCFYYRALWRLGYTKDMDDEQELVFKSVLNDGHNLSFFAEDKESGKIAGCRIITMEKKVRDPPPVINNRICRAIMTVYNDQVDECNLFERYNLEEIPHMFGLSVDEEFCRQGLAIELYRRAKALMKERGFKIALVAFISPYSRAAGAHHGFIQLSTRSLLDVKDEDGNVLYPQADPNDYSNTGVFMID